MSGGPKWILALAAALGLAACDGGSSTGGGTQNSPFVGKYRGATTVTVSTPAGTHTAEAPMSIYVNPDGLVQFGDDNSIIYASAPLQGKQVRVKGDAAALVDAECSGSVSITGSFSDNPAGQTAFQGQWSSNNAACFGVHGRVTGRLSARHASPDARASRVFETHSPALLRAFRGAVL